MPLLFLMAQYKLGCLLIGRALVSEAGVNLLELFPSPCQLPFDRSSGNWSGLVDGALFFCLNVGIGL
jgi:hypothetical protein